MSEGAMSAFAVLLKIKALEFKQLITLLI